LISARFVGVTGSVASSTSTRSQHERRNCILGTHKGAAGVLVGLAAPVVGLLAATGLLLLLAGALAARARHRDCLREAVPALPSVLSTLPTSA